MFQNYLKIARRTLLKTKAMLGINELGSAICIATFLIITLGVVDELSYNRNNQKADQIAHVIIKGNTVLDYQGIVKEVKEEFIIAMEGSLEGYEWIRSTHLSHISYEDYSHLAIKTLKNIPLIDKNDLFMGSHSEIRGVYFSLFSKHFQTTLKVLEVNFPSYFSFIQGTLYDSPKGRPAFEV